MPQGNKKLVKTIATLQEWSNSRLDETNFARFCDYLFTRCQFIQVEADDQNTAFTMFEPLNSTSDPLTAFEVFRSKVVRELPTNSEFINTMLFLDYENSKRDDITRKSNDLVFTMAQTYSGKRLRKHFVQLKSYLDTKISVPFIDSLEKASLFMKSVWIEQCNPGPWFTYDTKDCIRFLKAADHDVFLPVLLRYYLADPANTPSVVSAVTSFFALWRPIAPTNKLPDVYRKLLNSNDAVNNMAIEGGNLKPISDFKNYLLGVLRERIEGDLGEEKSTWVSSTKQLYLNYEDLPSLCRYYILLDLDSTLKANLIPVDPWTSKDDIEHILARKTIPAPSNIDTIGNLTFLPPTINKSISDMIWSDKKEIYCLLAKSFRNQNNIPLLPSGNSIPPAVIDYLGDPETKALAHLEIIAQAADWNESSIETRKDDVLSRCWDKLIEKLV